VKVRAVRNRSSRVFGVLTTLAKDIFRSRYHAELLSGIFRRVGILGHQLKIFTPSERVYASLDQIFQEHELDGLFILTWRWIRPEISRLIETTAHRRVLFFNDPLPGLGVNVVYTDVAAGMDRAVAHLVREGRRKIGMLHGPAAVPFKVGTKKITVPFIDTLLKKEGFFKALRSRRISANNKWIRAAVANSEREGYRLMKKWLREKDLPGAVVCGNDDLAFGAITALVEAGKRVPQDVAVIGFDDNDRAGTFTPPLTTVRQPLVRMGEDAVDILIRQIERPAAKPVSRKYLPQLVLRNTA
jgi:LacI family transcriptional regulator